MSLDDQSNQNNSARKHLLEEIRRRAEEAELKRLEDEDRSRSGSDPVEHPTHEPSAQFPVPSTDPPHAASKVVADQKVLVLRERLTSALERGKAEKAAELFADLSKLIPDDPSLTDFKVRLFALQEEKQKIREKPRVPEPRPQEVVADKATREVTRKKIANMLEAGDTYYQQEKYDKAFQYVLEVLSIDPSNFEAANLRAQIEKAQLLADRIRLEDEQRKAGERASRETKILAAAPELSPGRPTDFWGSSLTGSKQHSDYDVVPEEKGPVGPPPPPISQRIIRSVSSVRLPVKPILTIAVILILGAAVWYIVDTIRNTVSPARYSVLVLPGETSGDTSIAYVAQGFAEDLMADMGRVPEMRVIAPATSFAFGASTALPSQVAKALGANYVLSWSMVRAQGAIDLQMAFADTATGKIVWATKQHVPLREIPALRPEILRSLAVAMNVKLGSGAGNLFLHVSTGNETAFDLYARGRSLLRGGERFAPEEAIRMFEEATRLDPEYGDAHAASAWAHMVAYETSAEMAPSHIAQALTSVQKAMTTGLRTAEIFRAWGLTEQARGQYDKAIERFEQAVSVSPSDAEAQRRLAIAYAAEGRLDLAVKAAQRSVADDPGNIAAHTILGQLHQFKALHLLDYRDEYRAALRSYEQGLRLARDKSEYASGFYADVLIHLQQSERAVNLLLDRVARGQQSYVDYYKLGRVQQSAGKPIPEWQESFVRARTALSAHLEERPDDAVAYAYLSLVHTRLGEFKDAIASITRAQQLAPGDVDVLYLTARMYTLQKDKPQALEFLRKALGRRFSLGSVLDMDFFNLYSEPEFIAILSLHG